MFGKKWQNSVLIEGEKEAVLVSRAEGLPDVNPDMSDVYPVDLALPKKRSLWGALKKSLQFSKMGLYNLVFKRD